MAKLLLLTIAGFLITASPLWGREYIELKQAEKIALSLTGRPLPKDMREQFLEGKIELKDITETLSKGEGFIEYFAQYWTRALNIVTPVSTYQIRIPSRENKPIFDLERAVAWDLLTVPELAPKKNKELLQRMYDERINTLPHLTEDLSCDDAPLLNQFLDASDPKALEKMIQTGTGADGKPMLPGTQDIWRKTYEAVRDSITSCGKGEIIHPWWEPVGVTIHAKYKNAPGYRVGPRIISICGGPTLPKCDLRKAGIIDNFTDEVNRAMAMEPGYIISHTVAEDKPYPEVLTTTKTILTGAYGYWFSKRVGKEMLPNFPGGGFKDKESPAFTQSVAQGTRHHWVDRNELNAGVLTTPVFQTITNGRRAKANKTYEVFVCRSFFVPDGIPADPSDSNPDLTKRAYCSICHVALEPMATFFNRWPGTGVNNFQYDPAPNADVKGRFFGKEEQGVPGFARLVSSSDEFKECGVKRAFEFVNGRKMSEEEVTKDMAGYLATYNQTQGNLRTIIKQMLLNPTFLNPEGR